MSDYDYIDLKQTAVYIRADLKAAFPGVTFSVRGKSYSGGASITVTWTDGPMESEVKKITGHYVGSSFDGMIDLKSSVDTVRNGKRVRYASDYVHTDREYSAALLERIAAEVCREENQPVPVINPGSGYGAHIANDSSAHNYTMGERDTLAQRIMRRAGETSDFKQPSTSAPAAAEPDSQIKTACELCGAESDSLREYDGHLLCADCEQRASDYAARLEARYERMKARADRLNKEGQADYNHARKMGEIIPFGQPILIGHYSEGRDRRYRERIHNTYGRAFAKMERAKEYERRAESKSTAISSDDPAALLKLQDKLARLEARQELMKRANIAVRKQLKRDVDFEIKVADLAAELKTSEGNAAQLLKPDFAGRVGFADYQLTNNSAEIRRVKARIASLEKTAQKRAELVQATGSSVTREEHGAVVLERDTDENRLRLYFPGKPEARIISLLKQRGFRWSPSIKAWQRQMSNAAEYEAEFILKEAGVWVEKAEPLSPAPFSNVPPLVNPPTVGPITLPEPDFQIEITQQPQVNVIESRTMADGRPYFTLRLGAGLRGWDVLKEWQHGKNYNALFERIERGEFIIHHVIENGTVGVYYRAGYKPPFEPDGTDGYMVENQRGIAPGVDWLATAYSAPVDLGPYADWEIAPAFEPDGSCPFMVENQRSVPPGVDWLHAHLIPQEMTAEQVNRLVRLALRLRLFNLGELRAVALDNPNCLFVLWFNPKPMPWRGKMHRMRLCPDNFNVDFTWHDMPDGDMNFILNSRDLFNLLAH